MPQNNQHYITLETHPAVESPLLTKVPTPEYRNMEYREYRGQEYRVMLMLL